VLFAGAGFLIFFIATAWLLGREYFELAAMRFRSPADAKAMRKHNAATVFADSDDYPSFADATADFIYARLMRTQSKIKTGYAPKALDGWAKRATTWAQGKEPADLPRVTKAAAPKSKRDVFIFMISGAKERAPAAAQALIERIEAKK